MLSGTAWSRHQGDIYSAKLDGAPVGLSGMGVSWSEAHYPNRGHLTTDQNTPYLPLAADSPIIDIKGKPASNALAIGTDFVLPPGAVLDSTARARIRINDWHIDELQVSRADSDFIYLKDPTRYPARKGWGYFLVGQLWMVDSAGEWSYDAPTKTLYVQMPSAPRLVRAVRVATLPRGIDFEGRSFIEVRGLAIRNTGVGAWLRNTTSVRLVGSTIDATAGSGVDVGGSLGAAIESSTFIRTGGSAIDGGGGPSTRTSTALSVINNRVLDAGVAMAGTTIISLPVNATAAIIGGDNTQVIGNTIENAAYLGIRVFSKSIVENNLVRGACTVLDDGAGIYTWASIGVQIRNNLILNTKGSIQGKPVGSYTRANGIYLDESVRASLVEGNTVVDADHGIFLHVSSQNTIRGNHLYANRRSQLRLSADRNKERPTGDLYDNTIESNEFSPVTRDSVAVLLENSFGGTSAFGTFDRNRYADRITASLIVENTNNGRRVFSFAGWRAGAAELPSTRDPHGAAISESTYASYAIGGASLVPNGNFASDTKGWSTWNQTAPLATLTRDRCDVGWCLSVVAGGSPAIVSSSYFGIQRGQWYRLSLDIQADTENQPIQLVVRRGGGGPNSYATLMDRSLSTTGSRSWKRHVVVFQAIDTAEPIEKPNQGARLDFEGIIAGFSVQFTNVEIVPVSFQTNGLTSSIIINPNPGAVQQDCMLSPLAMCGSMLHMSDFSPVGWPIYLPSRTGATIFSYDRNLADADGDSIPDAQDRCPSTPAGAGVNSAGCALGQ